MYKGYLTGFSLSILELISDAFVNKSSPKFKSLPGCYCFIIKGTVL